MWKLIILEECNISNKTLPKINHDPLVVSRNMGKIASNHNRRSRTPNWSINEKQYLLELIRLRKDVVVTQNNNGPNHSIEKDVAWNEILRELALKFGSKFVGSSTKKVKTQWQNMKRIAREEISVNGPSVQKYTKQSIEVCHILDLIQDGVIKIDSEISKEPEISKELTALATNIEIKTERIEVEDDIDQQSGSGEPMESTYCQENEVNETPLQSSSSSSHHTSDIYEDENLDDTMIPEPEPQTVQPKIIMKDISIMTEPTISAQNMEGNNNNVNPIQRTLHEFLRYTATEKNLKMETLKEERQIVRAMRETAELNKIIAEQRLKHVLWVKRHEMMMYSGEPGSGAGKGGGGGGAIREAGGSFGKMEAAREDEYFYKKQREQLAEIKSHLDKEISFHQDQIKRHEDAIRRTKEQQATIEKK